MYPSLLALAAVLSVCKVRCANTCDVFPKDQYIAVGSDIQILCQTSCVRGKVFWTLNNKRVDESLSHVINSTHTVLSLRNFNHQSATLQCHSENIQQVLGGTTISTYSKPSKLSCILHYDNQNFLVYPPMADLLTCNWEHHINTSLKINYTVLVCSPHDSSNCEICSSNVTTCTGRKIDLNDNISIMHNNNLIVRANTSVWEAYSDPYEFDYYNILKLLPPKLKVTVLSGHLLVEWKPLLDGKHHCQIKYSKNVSDGTPEKVMSQTLNPTENVALEIKVESCHYYKVSGRCALNIAPWSDWSHETTVLTKLNRSDIKLRLWRKIDKPEKNGMRKVHVKWTEIPSTCKSNQQISFVHVIKLIPCKEHMTESSCKVTSCCNSTCDVSQDAHRINLTLFLNETFLAEDSVYVPAIGESLPQVTDIQTTAEKGIILVSWKAPVQPTREYMIDWTHNGNQYYWKKSKDTYTTLSDLLDKKPYNITVTPLFDDKTGHGREALQICSRVGGPGNLTIVRVQPKYKSVYVSWNITSQEECSGTVKNYTIFYRTQEEPMLNLTVNSTVQEAVLQDLIPNNQYSVYVKATALTGTGKSRERVFNTKQFDPRLITELSVSGSVIIVLILSIGLCCAIQWRKFREKPVPNPGLSSVALWPPADHAKGMCFFQAFRNPSEISFEKVYTEGTQTSLSTPSPTTSCDGNTPIDLIEYTDPAVLLAPVVQDERPCPNVETQHSDSNGESTELLTSKDGTSSPYRSQSSVEMNLRMNKHCKRVPVKQKTAPMTVYVTLNMIEQGQGR